MVTEKEKKDLAGCFLAVWAFAVSLPMWLILLFALMQANDMPQWAWVLYWVYVPVQLLGALFSGVFKVMFD